MQQPSSGYRITSNALAVIGSRVLGLGTAIVAANMLARHLSVEDFGRFSYALAVAAILGNLTDLGIKSLLLREVARDKSKAAQYLANALALKLLLSGVVLTLLFLALHLAERDEVTTLAIIVAVVAAVVGGFARLVQSLLRSYERFEYESAVSAAAGFLTLLLYAGALALGMGVGGLALVILVLAIFELLPLVWTARQLTGITARALFGSMSFENIRTLSWQSLPFAAWALLGTIYVRIDTVMLEAMRGLSEVAIYSAAYRFHEALLFIPAALSGALLPALSHAYSTSPERYRTLYRKGIKLALLIGLPSSIGLAIVADQVVWLIWTDKYLASIVPARILAASSAFSFILSMTTATLTSMNLQRLVAFFALIGVIANVGLNLLLLPTYGAVGASLATAATEGVLALLGLSAIHSRLRVYPSAATGLKLVVATTVMVLAAWSLRQQHIVVPVAGGAIVYGAALILLAVLSPDERQQIWSVVSRRGNRAVAPAPPSG